jgi:hypothetical protein
MREGERDREKERERRKLTLRLIAVPSWRRRRKRKKKLYSFEFFLFSGKERKRVGTYIRYNCLTGVLKKWAFPLTRPNGRLITSLSLFFLTSYFYQSQVTFVVFVSSLFAAFFCLFFFLCSGSFSSHLSGDRIWTKKKKKESVHTSRH